ncbi:MAG: hypothetical protein JXA62_05270 [Candidatus Aminicenantes bacterium]|nr:hypothetical protein [Candidatus Aminicenantes bacterium]
MIKGKLKWSDLEMAFEFVSAGTFSDNSAYVSRSTGKTFWEGDAVDDLEELPPDVDSNPDYLAVPNKYDLDLGNQLVMDFARQEMPEHFEDIRKIFSRPGAYRRFKNFLLDHERLDDWYVYEARRTREALLEWCAENDIEVEE